MLSNKLLALAGLVLAVASAEEATPQEAMVADDECLGSNAGRHCSLNALQVRGFPVASDSAAEEEAGNTTEEEAGNSSDPAEAFAGRWHGWAVGGDKVWGSGHGTENIHGGNIGYFDRGMYLAHSLCGGAGCALITNPMHHRTKEVFHIHFVHYGGYGASLKRKLEHKVCRSRGWHGGGLPCGGRAAFFPGFPGIFRVARGGGSISHASVIAWPASCGGRGTIVELAFHCSIEHQIRGDYNPRLR